MSLSVGCRVVRGPSWDYGDQDGGEGHVGTVIEIGKGNFAGWVVIVWDDGNRARYRVGSGGKYDLLLLDNACAGVEHFNVKCDGDCLRLNEQNTNICGMRWKCTQCSDFDLCTPCYMKGIHNKEHAFVRLVKDETTSLQMPPRRDAPVVETGGFFIGAKVTRGLDWNNGHEDGGKGSMGEIIDIDEKSGRMSAKVKWEKEGSKGATIYKIGASGKVELKCVEVGKGWPYIKDHLPVLGKAYELTFNNGARVTVVVAKEKLEAVQTEHGKWNEDMKEAIGKIGIVTQINDQTANVAYPDGQAWNIHVSALAKIPKIQKGDKVRISPDMALIKRLQPRHGGWNDAMQKELGKECRVLKVDSDGDVRIKTDLRLWAFHPSCLEVVEKNAFPADSKSKEKDDSGGGLEALLELLGGSTATKKKYAEKDASEPTHERAREFVNAATEGEISKLRSILSETPEVRDGKYRGQTAMFAAIGNGQSEAVKFLVEAGLSVTTRDGRRDGTTLHHAVEVGHEDILRYLLSKDSTLLDEGDKDGLTPLHVAAYSGKPKCGKILVENNCNPNLKDKKGNTPLHVAIIKKKDDIDFLLDAPRLDIMVTNKKGFNALHVAVFHNVESAAKKLIQRFPDLVSATTESSGQYSIHIASINNYCDLVELLITDGGADINARNDGKQTALHLAVEEGKTESIELLIGYEADINAKDRKGETPLHVAAKLFQKDGDVRETPTLNDFQHKYRQHGITTCSAAVLVLLVHNGSKVSEEDKRGKTPLAYVRNSDIKELLQKLNDGESVKTESVPVTPAQGPYINHVNDQEKLDLSQDFDGVHRIKASEINMKETIGRGAFGEVHRAQWRGTPVAVKVISTTGSKKSDVEKEVAVHKRTHHPNIARLMAMAYRSNEALLVMQLIEGSNLQDVVFPKRSAKKLVLSRADKLRISIETLQATRFLHESRILHLDIKPSNIIIETLTKRPYLCDLGLAHIKTRNAMSGSSIGVRGTPFYMPPESFKGRGGGGSAKMSAASDIWSLASSLLEMFTEKTLWGTDNSVVLIGRLLGSHVKPPTLKMADSDVRRILEPCFQKSPDSRPSAATLMEQFKELK